MRPLASRSPGKVILAGEYAVLEGAPAIVCSVDRYAEAWVDDHPRELSPFLLAVKERLQEHFGNEHPTVGFADRIFCNTSTMRTVAGSKLGLGSSAAATVAATAVAIGQGTGGLDLNLLHKISREAHGNAQWRMAAGAARGCPPGKRVRGSGVDIAAATYGGLLEVRPTQSLPRVRPLTLPSDWQMCFVYAGQPADTRELVGRVTSLARGDAATYGRGVARIAAAAEALFAALIAQDGFGAMEALRIAGRAMVGLGQLAGVDLEQDVHRKLRQHAEACGGAAKATGAGVGDIALAVLPDLEAAAAFRTRIRRVGIHPLQLRVEFHGTTLVDRQ